MSHEPTPLEPMSIDALYRIMESVARAMESLSKRVEALEGGKDEPA